jgi:hypothetical protein
MIETLIKDVYNWINRMEPCQSRIVLYVLANHLSEIENIDIKFINDENAEETIEETIAHYESEYGVPRTLNTAIKWATMYRGIKQKDERAMLDSLIKETMSSYNLTFDDIN